MDSQNLTFKDGSLHCPDFPNAEKLIQVDDPIAHRLADLALHRNDLEFALRCLDKIQSTDDLVIGKALFFTAVVHLYKCFSHSAARAQLPFEKVLKDDAEGIEIFRLYKDFRDKHVVHDENNVNQCNTAAVLNKKGNSNKIEKILCFTATALILDHAGWNNVRLLITKTLDWVTVEFDALAEKLRIKLELLDYEQLDAMPLGSTARPKMSEAAQTRPNRFANRKLAKSETEKE